MGSVMDHEWVAHGALLGYNRGTNGGLMGHPWGSNGHSPKCLSKIRAHDFELKPWQNPVCLSVDSLADFAPITLHGEQFKVFGTIAEAAKHQSMFNILVAQGC